MAYPNRQQLVGALVLLVSALFVSVRLVKPQYQTSVRRVCIVGFLIALCVVLAWLVVWAAS
jgi:hypothetical protein